ncbi:MAG: hypothetical protein MUP81_02870 [Dehalococcoidia bacterium]|nr:hypothetical protein [Dehalococcoidia bacterium]
MRNAKRIPVKTCEVTGCKNPARYGLYELCPYEKKKWKFVCAECEQRIGDNNLRLQGIDKEEL